MFEEIGNSNEDWKSNLELEIKSWLARFSEYPTSEKVEGDGSLREADLYSFFEQLCSFRNEQKTTTRKNNDILNQFNENLSKFSQLLHTVYDRLHQFEEERDKMSSLSERNRLLSLVDIFIRLDRVKTAMQNPPVVGFWMVRKEWVAAWENLRQGFLIVYSHMESLLKKEGVDRMKVAGQQFDPQLMVAVASEKSTRYSKGIVSEEINPGFLYNSEILKFAEVKVSEGNY